MGQLLLISDPRPLDASLGKKFFRNAPKQTGVYLMRDANEKVLYVGKAKNLRNRLRNYRTANPDKMPRRHLKMLRRVARIEFQLCHNETAALVRESKLIRSLKPKFNRAGVWPGKTKFIVWQASGDSLALAVTDVPQQGWKRFGPLTSSARYLHQTISRLVWLASNLNRSYCDLPVGWRKGTMSERVTIHCSQSGVLVAEKLDWLFGGSADRFLLWLGEQFAHRTNPFERTVLEGEMKLLIDFAAKHKPTAQLALI